MAIRLILELTNVPEYNNLLIDANVLIAKVRGQDPPYQQQHTDFLFELIYTYPIKVLVIKKVLDEVTNKYSYLMPSINSLLKDLESMEKFRMIANIEFAAEISQILQIKKDAKKDEIDLSFEDATQIFYAKTRKVPLVSWDRGIIDYCQKHGIIAFRPDDFCNDYKRRYG